jgi:hypothetical protein
LIYKYEETTAVINEFLGLEKEKYLYPKKFYNPAVPVKNTQIWKK